MTKSSEPAILKISRAKLVGFPRRSARFRSPRVVGHNAAYVTMDHALSHSRENGASTDDAATLAAASPSWAAEPHNIV